MAAAASSGRPPGGSGDDGRNETSPPVQFGPRKESILAGGISDKETQDDSLGFAPYAEALAAFLVNPATKAPLTISIEGRWGFIVAIAFLATAYVAAGIM